MDKRRKLEGRNKNIQSQNTQSIQYEDKNFNLNELTRLATDKKIKNSNNNGLTAKLKLFQSICYNQRSD